MQETVLLFCDEAQQGWIPVKTCRLSMVKDRGMHLQCVVDAFYIVERQKSTTPRFASWCYEVFQLLVLFSVFESWVLFWETASLLSTFRYFFVFLQCFFWFWSCVQQQTDTPTLRTEGTISKQITRQQTNTFQVIVTDFIHTITTTLIT